MRKRIRRKDTRQIDLFEVVDGKNGIYRYARALPEPVKRAVQSPNLKVKPKVELDSFLLI